jgi:hypothetical protein
LPDPSVTKNCLALSNKWLARAFFGGHNPSVSNDSETLLAKRPSAQKRSAFIIQCVGFRCMAYRDSGGKWRDFFNGDEIEGEVTIISAA